ncbi:hypothetical protein J2S74_000223 [Evansella vedderi]|uniref:DUF1850 domain-containing protein n=1 Tax=Evansella vedderi TaxID=38282 RepID=A0ABT9ZQ49_9BACI|nr:DUF1850 domain-containing protein [Evansella vedderi]MDQ0252851.1 hypothetical protein [Evansella vedderi]
MLYLTITLFLLVLFASFHVSSPYLSLVIAGQGEEVLWKTDIQREEWFSHQYTHSVEKSPVIEKFKVNEAGEIVTMESWTKSFGAGMPFEQQGTVEMKDGFYILKDLNRPIHGGLLQMKPSSLYPHTFQFRDEELLLSEAPFKGKRLKIKVIPMTWFEVVSHPFMEGSGFKSLMIGRQ